MIICNLHGGMGNQLFQAYYTLLLNKNKRDKIIFLTSSLDKYKTIRSIEIADLINYSFSNVEIRSDFMFIAKFRILKLFCKIKILRHGIFKFLNFVVIDDYCSDCRLYEKFEPVTLNNHLDIFRTFFYKLQPASNLSKLSNKVYHLRLTDYFDSTNSEIIEIENFISNNYKNEIMYIVTDNEYLLSKQLGNNNPIYLLISTNGFSSQKLLLLFASFRHIYTSKSTLSFWASLLYKRNLLTTNCNFEKLIFLING